MFFCIKKAFFVFPGVIFIHEAMSNVLGRYIDEQVKDFLPELNVTQIVSKLDKIK